MWQHVMPPPPHTHMCCRTRCAAQDPDAVKPEDWDERDKIPDPAEKKPEGYDDIPATIVDPGVLLQNKCCWPVGWDCCGDGAGGGMPKCVLAARRLPCCALHAVPSAAVTRRQQRLHC